jgi:hypothetical protein
MKKVDLSKRSASEQDISIEPPTLSNDCEMESDPTDALDSWGNTDTVKQPVVKGSVDCHITDTDVNLPFVSFDEIDEILKRLKWYFEDNDFENDDEDTVVKNIELAYNLYAQEEHDDVLPEKKTKKPSFSRTSLNPSSRMYANDDDSNDTDSRHNRILFKGYKSNDDIIDSIEKRLATEEEKQPTEVTNVKNVFCVVRPPGHHAGRYGENICVLNSNCVFISKCSYVVGQ